MLRAHGREKDEVATPLPRVGHFTPLAPQLRAHAHARDAGPTGETRAELRDEPAGGACGHECLWLMGNMLASCGKPAGSTS